MPTMRLRRAAVRRTTRPFDSLIDVRKRANTLCAETAVLVAETRRTLAYARQRISASRRVRDERHG
jgi:hypothetical protein